ncbi:MAG: hypothetical protein WCL10_16985 [Novosphingobium sp.]
MLFLAAIRMVWVVWLRGPPPANFILDQDQLGSASGWSDGFRNGGRSEMSNNGFFTRIGKALRGEAPPSMPSAPAAPAVLPATIDYEDDRIPSSAKARIRRILAGLLEVENALLREDMPNFSRVDIDQMREQHLPKLVKSYIDIPEAHRAEIFRKTGKSASFILDDSLDQMQTRVDTILRSLAQKDIETFTNNTKFVGERYSTNNPFD